MSDFITWVHMAEQLLETESIARIGNMDLFLLKNTIRKRGSSASSVPWNLLFDLPKPFATRLAAGLVSALAFTGGSRDFLS